MKPWIKNLLIYQIVIFSIFFGFCALSYCVGYNLQSHAESIISWFVIAEIVAIVVS